MLIGLGLLATLAISFIAANVVLDYIDGLEGRYNG